MGKGFKSITYSFEGSGNFISFVDDFNKLIEALKEELEDDLNEDDVIEIYKINNERIENQTQYNLFVNDDSLTELRINVKKINKFEKEKQEQERLEKERLEKERLEKERLEKERLEKERLEKERLEKERLEKERLEKERLEKERLKQLEKERIEKEKLKRKATENTTMIKDELINKLSTLIDNKISQFYQQLNENKEQINSMCQNFEKKINEIEKINQSKNNQLHLKIKKISNIIKNLEENQQILYQKSNNTEKIESLLKNLKSNYENNNVEIKKQFNNITKNIENIINKPLEEFIKNNNKQITESQSSILNKNADMQSEFNKIQTKINELKHFKKVNNPTYFNTFSSFNTGSENYSDEQSYFPNNEIELKILTEKNKFKYSDLKNGLEKIKISFKSKNELPKNCKFATLKNSQKDIYFDDFLFVKEIPKDTDTEAALRFKFENNNKKLSGKYSIYFGLYKPQNILVKKFKYELEIN
jgi:hypothetical protein